MFKFVHVWQPGDAWEPLAADGFVGIERGPMLPHEAMPDGPKVIGWSSFSVFIEDPLREDEAEPAYVVATSPHTPPARSGAELREVIAQMPPDCLLLVLNAGGIGRSLGAWTGRKVWDVLEAAHHPRIKAAFDIEMARAVNDRAAVVVPTLNLRIGLVRVRQIDDELTGYARRLAGIGFDGYITIDPPAGPDRAAASIAVAAAFREVLPPPKPVKKVPAKVAK